MIQSLHDLPENIYRSFGTVIVDECHHIPAATFRDTIERFHTYYLYGFTATPFRRSNDEKLIFIYLGDVIHEVAAPIHEMQRPLSVTVRRNGILCAF
jgi:superfamily II DNA or RNA helicase